MDIIKSDSDYTRNVLTMDGKEPDRNMTCSFLICCDCPHAARNVVLGEEPNAGEKTNN